MELFSQWLIKMVELHHKFFLDTLKQTREEDGSWYSSLNDTHWLSCVSSCLKMSIKVLDCMAKKRKTVILKGNIYDLFITFRFQTINFIIINILNIL